MRIHYLLPFLRKFKSFFGPARLLSFLCGEFALRRQLTRFRKNQNCSLTLETRQMAAVTFTADGYVNNNKFREYIPRRELYIKRITKT